MARVFTTGPVWSPRYCPVWCRERETSFLLSRNTLVNLSFRKPVVSGFSRSPTGTLTARSEIVRWCPGGGLQAFWNVETSLAFPQYPTQDSRHERAQPRPRHLPRRTPERPRDGETGAVAHAAAGQLPYELPRSFAAASSSGTERAARRSRTRFCRRQGRWPLWGMPRRATRC